MKIGIKNECRKRTVRGLVVMHGIKLDWIGLDFVVLQCIALHCIALHVNQYKRSKNDTIPSSSLFLTTTIEL